MSTEEPVQQPEVQQTEVKKERKKHEKGEKHEKGNKNEKHEKGEKHEKPEREKVKHERPAEYERNADLITVDTELEPLPKKNTLLQKPNLKEYQEREAKNKERVQKIIEKKKEIYAEKFKAAKIFVKGEGGKHDVFNQEIQEFNDLKERFNEVKTQRNLKKDLLNTLFQEAKDNNAEIKNLKELERNSKERLEEQLEALEHELITSDISKERERQLQSEITILKRKALEAQPAGNIKIRIQKAEQRKEELSGEIDKAKEERTPLDKEFDELRKELDSKNEAISKLKGEIRSETEQKTEAKSKQDQEYENWKEGKKQRLDELSAKIKAIDEENKNIWKEYKEKMDKYWEQKHKVDFLEWQHRVKESKVRAVEREKKRLLFEQKEKEREKEEQLQKYIKEIEICNTLVSFLNELIKKEEKTEKVEQKSVTPEDVNAKIGQDSQWQKEKGLIVLSSKKNKDDEEVVPKKGGKKPKRKAEKEETTAKKFEVPFSIQILFDQVKVLPPESVEDVEKKIAEVREREALFERGCREEVSEEDKQQIETIQGGKKEKKEKKTEQKTEGADEFPTL